VVLKIDSHVVHGVVKLIDKIKGRFNVLALIGLGCEITG